MKLTGSLIIGTLCFLLHDNKVCLAMKKKKIGKGFLNGYGGGLEKGETETQAATRELQQESRVIAKPHDLKHIAVITFHNRKKDGTVTKCKIYVYLLERWHGTPQETDEMGPPEWYPIDELPLDKMMLGDKEWFPKIFDNRNSIVIGDIFYGPGQASLDKESQFRILSAGA